MFRYTITLDYQENKLFLSALKAEHIDPSCLMVAGRRDGLLGTTYYFDITTIKTAQNIVSRYPLYAGALGERQFALAQKTAERLDIHNNVLAYA